MEAAQKKLKEMRADRRKTSNDIKKIQKEIDHWKRKMDDAGETHHRYK